MIEKREWKAGVRALHERYATTFLLMVILVDMVFISIHGITVLTGQVVDSAFNVSHDGSHPEHFQYLKFLLAAGLFVLVTMGLRSPRLLVWAACCLYMFVDDATQFHEQMGRFLAGLLQIQPAIGLQSHDLGELIVAMAAGMILVPLMMLTFFDGSRMSRQISKDVVLLIAILVFFGVFIDALHAAVGPGLAIIEDGGEMIAASLIAWYALLIRRREGRLKMYLSEIAFAPFRTR